jgi:hypothetical protein
MSEDRGRIMVLADLPVELEDEFLEYVQAFHRSHPGSNFTMLMQANQSINEVASRLASKPGFNVTGIIGDKKKLT